MSCLHPWDSWRVCPGCSVERAVLGPVCSHTLLSTWAWKLQRTHLLQAPARPYPVGAQPLAQQPGLDSGPHHGVWLRALCESRVLCMIHFAGEEITSEVKIAHLSR